MISRDGGVNRHIRLGDAARNVKLWPEARRQYESAVATDAGLDHIWVQLGHARKELGDYQGAEDAYQRALTLKPEIPDTHLQLGHLYKMSGRFDEAAEAYAGAGRLDPGLIDAGRELAALGYSPNGMRLFGVSFDGPHGLERSIGVRRLDFLASLTGITAAEALRLMEQRGLRIGYRLHEDSSALPATHSGYATVEMLKERTLRCRIEWRQEEFTPEPLRLLYIGVMHEDRTSTDDWKHLGVWVTFSFGQLELTEYYLFLNSQSK